MPRKTQKYLEDILEACTDINDFIAGKSEDDYLHDKMLRAAVERKLAVIGEALSQAIRLDETLAEYITEAPKIIGFRNRLIHGYGTIANDIVWQVLLNDLPVLNRNVTELLGK